MDPLLRETNPPPGQKPAIVPQLHDIQTNTWGKVQGKDGAIYVEDDYLADKLDDLIEVVSTSAGVGGSRWFYGEGVPGDTSAVVGDYYLDTQTGDIYRFSAGVWVYLTNLMGKSAYDIWIDAGNVGTEDDFLESLKKFSMVINGGSFFS